MDYSLWMYSGIHPFIAMTAIFVYFGMMGRKKHVPLICIILLMVTIHGSAVMSIPIAFIIQWKV